MGYSVSIFSIQTFICPLFLYGTPGFSCAWKLLSRYLPFYSLQSINPQSSAEVGKGIWRQNCFINRLSSHSIYNSTFTFNCRSIWDHQILSPPWILLRKSGCFLARLPLDLGWELWRVPSSLFQLCLFTKTKRTCLPRAWTSFCPSRMYFKGDGVLKFPVQMTPSLLLGPSWTSFQGSSSWSGQCCQHVYT